MKHKKQSIVKKYKLGNPIETNIIDRQIFCEDNNNFEHFQIFDDDIVINLNETDIVYGLGQSTRGINKRGFIYKSFCVDDDMHTENKSSLYGSHNILIIKNKAKIFAIYTDYPGEITYDIGYTDSNILKMSPKSLDINLYIITSDSLKQIIKEFRSLIGPSYVPPKWAFGYQQSRWGYETESDIKNVVENFKKNNLPIDSIYLDIDYMQQYKNFTVDQKSFPNFEKLVKDLLEENIKLVPIIDAAVRIEKDYELYEEGAANNYFCKDEYGNDFEAGCWPGKVCFPDFLNEKSRNWFSSKYKFLIDKGINGFWNDMNEPAIFYTPEGISSAVENVNQIKDNDIDLSLFFTIKDGFSNLMNRMQDYKSFYHTLDEIKFRNDIVHNLYAYFMTKGCYEYLDKEFPDKRFLLFSRSSCIGSHKHSGVWTGDNRSWWSHLLMNIKHMASLNMCGFIYSGADIGGFSDNTTEDLLIRWMQFGIFAPLFRNHAAKGTRNQEPYNFNKVNLFKNILNIRYSLILYIYSEYMKAIIENIMYFSPLSFEYESDTFCLRIEDQLLVGESIMIAPIYEQNGIGRYVYLPEDMLFIKFKEFDKYHFEVRYKGHNYIDISIEETHLFLRKNKILPLTNPATNVESIDCSTIYLIAFVCDIANFEIYDDDGYSKGYLNHKNFKTNIGITKKGQDYIINIENNNNKFKHIEMKIFDENGYNRTIYDCI